MVRRERDERGELLARAHARDASRLARGHYLEQMINQPLVEFIAFAGRLLEAAAAEGDAVHR